MTGRAATRFAAALLGALAVVALVPGPASADAPRPTDYRSTVVAVSPSLPPGAHVRIIGGDSLIELSLPRGHTAVVADYPTSRGTSSVPYLRFDADGTVRRNARAVATTANEARYGSSDRVPDPDAAPRWETVATDGRYAWHDHRIHWMSPTAPRAVDRDGRVDLGGDDGTWSVPLTIDGRPTTVTGELVLVDPPSPLPWVVLACAAAAATFGACARWGLRAGSAVGATTGALAVIAAVATWRAVPADAGASAVPVGVAVIALLAGALGVAGPRAARLGAGAAAAAALLGWGATRWTVLARAVLPTDLAPVLDRGITALAIGVGAGLAVALVVQPSPRGRPAGDPSVRSSPTA